MDHQTAQRFRRRPANPRSPTRAKHIGDRGRAAVAASPLTGQICVGKSGFKQETGQSIRDVEIRGELVFGVGDEAIRRIHGEEQLGFSTQESRRPVTGKFQLITYWRDTAHGEITTSTKEEIVILIVPTPDGPVQEHPTTSYSTPFALNNPSKAHHWSGSSIRLASVECRSPSFMV
ncbi:MAG: hypothetical protein HOL13_05265 [Phycisphaerae bacterium]|nr:hypothetical protein [Phycisphaerae bacterium]